MKNHNQENEQNKVAEQNQLFDGIFKCVFIVASFYTVFYYFFNAYFSSVALAVGVVLFTPVIYFIHKREKVKLARILFVLLCNYYIYFSSLGSSHKINAEYFCLPASMLGLILFDLRRKWLIVFSLCMAFATWGFIEFGSIFNIPDPILLSDFSFDIFQKVNFVASFLIVSVFLFIFTRFLNQNSEAEIRAIELTLLEKTKSEEKFKLLIESMQEGLVLQDASGKIIQYNKAALEILGVREDQLLGYSSMNVGWKCIKEDGSDFKGEDHPAMVTIRTKQPIKNVIMGIVHADGPTRWIRINSMPFLVKEGEMGAFTAFTELTEMLNVKSQLELAQSVAKVGSWSFNIANNQIFWSKQMFELFPDRFEDGPPSFEKHFNDIHKDDRTLWKATVDRCCNEGTEYKIRYRSVFKDKTLWVEAIGQPKRNQVGKIVELFGTCQDITEKVQIDNENELILDALQIGVWKFNPITNSLHWDKSMYKVFDIEEKDFSGHYEAWENSLTPEAKEKAVLELQQALKGEKEFNTTFEINAKNNTKKQIAGRANVIRNNNNEPVMVYGINYDRTKEKLLESALEIEKTKAIHSAKLASLGEMSAGIAHEINNPLATISGSIPLIIKNKDNPEKLRDRVEIIERSVERIAKIVRGLRKFSRTTGDSVFKPEILKNVVNETYVLVESKKKRHNVDLNFDLRTDAKILCDEIEIQQVIVNLINNSIDAVKDLDQKWTKVVLFEEGDEVVLQIIDSGKFISKFIEDKLFQPFFTTKPVGEGTGIGLSISKGILDQHKASIVLNREIQNTCFEIRFKKCTS